MEPESQFQIAILYENYADKWKAENTISNSCLYA